MTKKNKNSLDNSRFERYIEKLDYFRKLMDKLEEWVKDIDANSFISLDLKEQFGIYHIFQIIVEIITDLIAMICKDLKIKPKDDYSNINYLREYEILSEELSDRLRKINGLRNVLVHNYNGLDDMLAFKSIKENILYIKKIHEVFQKWLRKNF